MQLLTKFKTMKTIDEAAKELKCPIIDLHNMIGFRAAFKKGVEFAQRWIPIEEELPPLNKWINVKYESSEGLYYGSTIMTDLFPMEVLKNNFQYWRLIELE